MYLRLVACEKKHNNTRVPRSFKADPELGRWMSKLRLKFKEKDRIDLLNEIGIEWKVTERTD